MWTWNPICYGNVPSVVNDLTSLICLGIMCKWRKSTHEEISLCYTFLLSQNAARKCGENVFGTTDFWLCWKVNVHILAGIYQPQEYPLMDRISRSHILPRHLSGETLSWAFT
uniref:Uncharacterized protein n=1 Tax=Schistocephalus solidus TaxID=70667 RepID=A0A0X3NKY5_SCHSO